MNKKGEDLDKVKPPPSVRQPEDFIVLFLRGAIPTADIGSRGSIAYAKEMAEIMEICGVTFCAMPDFNPTRVEMLIQELERADPRKMQ